MGLTAFNRARREADEAQRELADSASSEAVETQEPAAVGADAGDAVDAPKRRGRPPKAAAVESGADADEPLA